MNNKKDDIYLMQDHEHRITKLEIDLASVKTICSDIKIDMREIKKDLKEFKRDVADLKKAKWAQFRWIMGTLVLSIIGFVVNQFINGI